MDARKGVLNAPLTDFDNERKNSHDEAVWCTVTVRLLRRKEGTRMWDYAALSKAAKAAGGPAGLVLTLVAGGVAVGAAGVVAVQKMVAHNGRPAITDARDDGEDKESNEEE